MHQLAKKVIPLLADMVGIEFSLYSMLQHLWHIGSSQMSACKTRPMGQWSEPCTSGRWKMSCTFGVNASETCRQSTHDHQGFQSLLTGASQKNLRFSQKILSLPPHTCQPHQFSRGFQCLPENSRASIPCCLLGLRSCNSSKCSRPLQGTSP